MFSITYNNTGVPKFMPAPGIGTPSCDISLVARIPQGSALHRTITSIQRSAVDLDIHAHILPADQTHTTLVNAVCRENPPIPRAEEQSAIFAKFCSALSSEYVQSLLSEPVEMSFDKFLISRWDVKIGAENPAWGKKRKSIAEYLMARFGTEHFIPAEDHAVFHSTILRFSQGFSETDHAKLLKIMRTAQAEAEKNGPYTLTISPENIFAVKFPGKFMEWEMCRNVVFLAHYEQKYSSFMAIQNEGKERIFEPSGIRRNRGFFECDGTSDLITDRTQKCDYYPVIIRIPEDSGVGFFLREAVGEIKDAIPKNLKYAEQAAGTMHISVFTPKQRENSRLYESLTASFRTYRLALHGLRFMPDGTVIAVFYDGGQTSDIRSRAYSLFGAPPANRTMIHCTILRFLEDIDLLTLERLQALAEKYRDISSVNLTFDVVNLDYGHETRMLMGKLESL